MLWGDSSLAEKLKALHCTAASCSQSVYTPLTALQYILKIAMS